MRRYIYCRSYCDMNAHAGRVGQPRAEQLRYHRCPHPSSYRTIHGAPYAAVRLYCAAWRSLRVRSPYMARVTPERDSSKSLRKKQCRRNMLVKLLNFLLQPPPAGRASTRLSAAAIIAVPTDSSATFIPRTAAAKEVYIAVH